MAQDALTKHIKETYPGVVTTEALADSMRTNGGIYLDANSQVRIAGTGVLICNQPSVSASLITSTVTTVSPIYRPERGKQSTSN